jgi:uncharacterized membrane protein
LNPGLLVIGFLLICIAPAYPYVLFLSPIWLIKDDFAKFIIEIKQVSKELYMSDATPINPNVSVPHEKGVHLVRSITIDKPITELYRFWHDLSRLPEVFEHLESIQFTGTNRAHVTLKLPANIRTEFDAEIYTDVPNEVISWRSLPESELQNAGSIRFRETSKGAEVQMTVEYIPPGGALGKAISEILGQFPSEYLANFLREFKQMMETGENG